MRHAVPARAQVIRVVRVERVLTWRFWAVRILPVGFFMALTLLFGNIVYLYLTVAFIQMLKVGGAACDAMHPAPPSCRACLSLVPLAEPLPACSLAHWMLV